MFESTDHTFAVCAYGESPYLVDCVQSLMTQSLHTNVLISTSTPNDHIQQVAQRFGVPLYINKGRPGIAHDWNCALEHCDTPLVTIAHQDDIYLSDYARDVLHVMNEERHPLIAFTDYGELRGGGIALDDSRLLRIKRTMLALMKIRRLRASRLVRRRILSFGSPICCPSVTFCLPNLPTPVFLSNMKCDLDWEAWERLSKSSGSFIYIPHVLMRHRIHEGSETTALIADNTRSREDLQMLQKFWPDYIAHAINKLYSKSQSSNSD